MCTGCSVIWCKFVSGWRVSYGHVDLKRSYKYISHSDVYGRHPVVFITKPVPAETCSTHKKVTNWVKVNLYCIRLNKCFVVIIPFPRTDQILKYINNKMYFSILLCILFPIFSTAGFGPYSDHLQGYVLIKRTQLWLTVSPSLHNN